jgi:integration host factor subunit beta
MNGDPTAGLTRFELARSITDRIGGPIRQGEEILETILHSIATALSRGERVELRGFGTFYVHTRNARTGRNPMTGESVRVPVKKVAKFKVSKEIAKKLVATEPEGT